MTPKQIVNELDKYIIGQSEAKRAVAIALRNRYRRSQLSAEDREEITPKNIIMKGPTGVGKTEIARRLAKLVKAPFLKVEATKYTEVGYVGRDVESMIRDLVEVSIRLIKEERYRDVQEKALANTINVIAEALLAAKDALPENITRATLKDELSTTSLDHIKVEITVPDEPKPLDLSAAGGGTINIGNIFDGIMPKKTKKRKVTVGEAKRILLSAECETLIDHDSVNAEAIMRAENDGLIFIDELDKIAGGGSQNGPDVSREGVQRDILPIVEGCSVTTKYGNIKTDYILFIASGAFHVSKVSDLIPELQGRFPVLVELTSLGKDEFIRILTEPQNAITTQYQKLLAVDNIDLVFHKSGIEEIAEIAVDMNATMEDIGARRLQSILENLVENISFDVDETSERVKIIVDDKFVKQNLSQTAKTLNLNKYIL
ncbi:MAG TPA: ATP-dependent protease ATPase subunit HslU [Eubacteriales bacterium]|nr:ATP-dependent protease ATPase subunit HslU [Eubacteriales bacterium]